MNADDGSEQTRLTDNNANDSSPSWSPDGEKIAFSSNRDGNYEIYVMNADGSDVTRLTNVNNANDSSPSWSPDGEKIVFTSDRDSAFTEIYSMNADNGRRVTRLTDNNANDSSPNWGTNTSPPSGGGTSGDGGGYCDPTGTPPQQAINKAISDIQNLDNIPQSVKTDLIAHLRKGIDFLDNCSTTLPPPLRTNTP
jgi:TolB protein